ncbi:MULTISPECIES: lipopolysaccharide assembly protein LapA domain-containing protein [unclassified Geodermatophilus]|uniref:lipopolysaccharide assembly protein LapA domain-containing protein n=1 Tax=unclassified Geodermatophilus TaxID=2637632 RepID=UPI003EE952DD
MTSPGPDPLRAPSGNAAPTSSGGVPGPATGPAAAGAPAPTAGRTTSSARAAGRTVGRSLALALLVFVTVLLVLFVVFNTQTVGVSLVFGNVDLPLVVALLIAAALGGLLVWLAGLVLRARRRTR